MMADTSKSKSGNRSASDVRNQEANDVYGDVTEQLLEELRRVYLETGKVTDEVLSALGNVLQAPLLPALDLVDNHCVTLLTCPAGRKLYQVVGSSGTPYTCLTSSNYCTCPAYRFSVLKREDHSMCKHILAIKLSNAMGVTNKNLEITDQELTDLLKNLE